MRDDNRNRKRNRRTYHRRPGHGLRGFFGAAAILAALSLAGQVRQSPNLQETFRLSGGSDAGERTDRSGTAEAVTGQAPEAAAQTGEPGVLPERKPSGGASRTGQTDETDSRETAGTVPSPSAFTLADIPAYTGQDYTEVNGNEPVFSEAEKAADVFEFYSELDGLGRCGYAEAKLSPQLMPTEERGAIGQIRPTGWHTVKYEGIDGNYLYNRCHLIGYQLAGENANEKNLITGTRHMNAVSMLPWENLVAEYIRRTGGTVLYRVTPLFDGANLLASGVEMEAESLESDEIRFHIFVYNVQPGIEINYADGSSRME